MGQLLRERPETVLVTRAAEVIEQCGHMGELAELERGPASTRDALGPMVARVFEGGTDETVVNEDDEEIDEGQDS